MTDLISRAAVLKLLQDRLDMHHASKQGWGGVVVDIMYQIRNLPTQIELPKPSADQEQYLRELEQQTSRNYDRNALIK